MYLASFCRCFAPGEWSDNKPDLQTFNLSLFCNSTPTSESEMASLLISSFLTTEAPSLFCPHLSMFPQLLSLPAAWTYRGSLTLFSLSPAPSPAHPSLVAPISLLQNLNSRKGNSSKRTKHMPFLGHPHPPKLHTI